MGRKRKRENREDTEEEIQRKIKMLQEKLAKKTPKRSRLIIYSSSSDEASKDESEPPRGPTTPPTPPPPPSPPAENIPERPQPSSRSPSPAPNVHTVITEAVVEPVNDDSELDTDILQLLGDAPKVDVALGPPIHKDVASRWQEILSKGLSKETKDKLLQEYAVPSNCDLLMAPALNAEAKAALSESLVKRDLFLLQKQRQLGVALSALATATSLILSNETSKQKLVKPISDACRILCDNHFMETKSRRNMVISSTNTQLKDTLLESVRDKSWLFGENISDKLKAAKSIQRSGDDLKNQPKPAPKLNYYNKNNRGGRLNYKPQHRKTDPKPAASSGDSGRGRQPGRAPARNTYQRSSRRSPPRRTAYK